MILLRICVLLWLVRAVHGVVGAVNPFSGLFDTSDRAALGQVEAMSHFSRRGSSYFTSISDATAFSETIAPGTKSLIQFGINTTADTISNYQAIVFISGNICSLPDGWTDVSYNGLTLYYSFNETEAVQEDEEIMRKLEFQEGYVQDLAHVQLYGATNNVTLYLMLVADDCDECTGAWNYEIGVSQSNLVFQWHNESVASVVDTDATSAVIWIDDDEHGNLTAGDAAETGGSEYTFFIYEPDDFSNLEGLNHSWCAMRQGASLEYNSSSAVVSSVYRNGTWKKQFYFDNLEANTTYIGYMLESFGDSGGGLVFEPFKFSTMDADACTLIFDLDFCSEVTYSVPSLESISNVTELAKYYDANARDFYTNFSYALQQIACDTERDARFSPIRTCEHCADSYKSWLCSVTIPRCSTRNITGYKYYEAGHSRLDNLTPLESNITPEYDYFEVLPCIDMCNSIVRDCPADFNFHCPQSNETVALSYYWDTEYTPSCNRIGITSQ